MVPRPAIDLRKQMGAEIISANAIRIAGLKPALSTQKPICANKRIERLLCTTFVVNVFYGP
jgi:hypothetical protein